MPSLLANGKLGDVFTNDMILTYIKADETSEDYSWLEDQDMYVHFIDTSVFLNIVNVPGRNQQREEVMRELKELLKNSKVKYINITFCYNN